MPEHFSAGSGLRVACSLPPVVGATAFRCAEATVPQSSMQLIRVGVTAHLPPCSDAGT